MKKTPVSLGLLGNASHWLPRGIKVVLGFCVFLGRLDSTPGMLRGCVDGRQLQGTVAIVKNVVPGTARHEDGITNIQRARDVQMAFAGAHLDNGFAGFYPDTLVHVGVHLKADVIVHRDAHQGHLEVMACPEGSPVVAVCT